MSDIDVNNILSFPEDGSCTNSVGRSRDSIEANGDHSTPQPFHWNDLRAPAESVVRIVLGRAAVEQGGDRCPIAGSVLPLDRAVGDAVEVMVDERTVALGQLVVVQGKMAVEVTNLVSSRHRRSA